MTLIPPQREARYGDLTFAILCLVISLWTLPEPVVTLFDELDTSWMVGLHLAFRKGWEFGRDVVFTYGPLGFLAVAVPVDHDLWRASLTFNLFCHFYYFAAQFVLIRTSVADRRWRWVWAVALFSFVPEAFEYKIVLGSAALLARTLLAPLSPRSARLLPLVVGFVLGIGSLTKISVPIHSLLLIFFFVTSRLVHRRNLGSDALLISSYALSLGGAWILLGQSPASALSFVRSTMELTTGMAEAMGMPGPRRELAGALLCVAWFLYLLVLALKQRRSHLSPYLWLHAGVVIGSFKDGFVRQWMHAYQFIAPTGMVLAFAALLLREEQGGTAATVEPRGKVLRYLAWAPMGLLLVLIATALDTGREQLPAANLQPWKMFFERDEFEEASSALRARFKESGHLSGELVSQMGGRSVDIFPWNLGLLWAHDLNWRPRPVFQSYAVLTDRLARLNAEHFSGPEVPEFVLFEYRSMDNRYPLFEEPATLGAIQSRYEPLSASGPFVLLRRRDRVSPQTQAADLGETSARLDEPVKVPAFEEGYVFAEIRISYSLLGRLLNTLYKTSPPNIQFLLEGGTVSKSYLLVPGTARNGLLVSDYVADTGSLESFLRGNRGTRIEAITLKAKHPSQFKENFVVRFFGVGGTS